MSEKLAYEFKCDNCGTVALPPLHGWRVVASLDPGSDEQNDLCSPACLVEFFGGQQPTAAPATVRVLHDADDLDDHDDVRPWTSRRAWADEMFDLEAA